MCVCVCQSCVIFYAVELPSPLQPLYSIPVLAVLSCIYPTNFFVLMFCFLCLSCMFFHSLPMYLNNDFMFQLVDFKCECVFSYYILSCFDLSG